MSKRPGQSRTDAPPALVLTGAQVKAVDRIAIERYGVPGIVLMENAARALAEQVEAVRQTQRDGDGPILILCGGGNNGGDGFAAARHLFNRGLAVHLFALKPPDEYPDDAATNLRICRAMDLPITFANGDPVSQVAAIARGANPTVIVDALLGTGLNSAVRSPLDRLIGWINEQAAPALSVDIPSGLDCDTGRPLGAAVRAEVTVTFVAVKRGFTQPGANAYTGRVVVGDIGAPRQAIREAADV